VLARVIRQGFLESVHRGVAVITAPDGTVERAWGDPVDPGIPPLVAQAAASHRLAARGRPCCRPGPRPGLRLPLRARPGSRRASGPAWPRRGSPWTRCATPPGSPSASMRWPGLAGRRARQGAHRPELLRQARGHCCAPAWRPAGRWPTTSTRSTRCSGGSSSTVIADYAGDEPIVASAPWTAAAPPCTPSPLPGLARAFGRIASRQDGEAEAGRPRDARLPVLRRRSATAPDSELMAAVPGVIAKEGAEAVVAVGLPDGRGVAVKIADGLRAPDASSRPPSCVSCGVDAAASTSWRRSGAGHGERVEVQPWRPSLDCNRIWPGGVRGPPTLA
jgi:hypothetical protein